jgi:transcriptional regulator with XRE-family HTH domain
MLARVETCVSISAVVIDAERMESRMNERHITKSELARRVGVTPPAIRRMVSGDAYSSRYLHKIARELGTTPAYLTGETDDPLSNAPDEPELSRTERELVDCFGQLPPESQAALIHIAHSMANRAEPTMHAPKLTYRAQLQRQGRKV